MSAHHYALSLYEQGMSAQNILSATGVSLPVKARERTGFDPASLSQRPAPPPRQYTGEKYGPRVYSPKERIEHLINSTAAKHGITRSDILGGSHKRAFAWPRHELMYRLYTEYTLSLPGVGRIVGGRDHTTVRSGIVSYCNRIGIDYDTVSRAYTAGSDTRAPARAGFDRNYTPVTVADYRMAARL